MPSTAEPLRVAVLGAGRLGRVLAQALQARGELVIGPWSRTPERGLALAEACGCAPCPSLHALASPPPDAVLVCVPDDAIVATARLLPPLPTTPVLHTSGVHPASLLREAGLVGPVASFHPLAAIGGGDPHAARLALEGAFYAIEGSPAACAVGERWVRLLGGFLLTLDSDGKAAYHAAATLCAGALVALLDTALHGFAQAGIVRANALPAALHLARSALGAAASTPLEYALSGPIARGDADTVRAHRDAYARAADRDSAEVYDALARAQFRLARKGPLNGERLARLEDSLGMTPCPQSGIRHRPERAPTMESPMVRTGLDRLLTEAALLEPLRGQRLGWLVHAASVDAHGEHALRRAATAGLRRDAVFGPEHGLWGAAQDMIGVARQRDPIFGLEVESLYAECFEDLYPRHEQLAGLDAVIIDLQDVGSRYYTYVYSAAMMAQRCAEMGIEAIVLDRPNPLGGLVVEGNVVDPTFRSFVGFYPLATRHAMTIAEIVCFGAELEGWQRPRVVPMTGWKRDLDFADTRLPWVMPSPNMPTLDTAWVYPGLCLLEGTNVSEGRGTTRPFELFGAPWLEPERLAERIEPAALQGARLRPLVFRPTFQKYADQLCRGFQLHVEDRERFSALRFGVALLQALWCVHPQHVRWRTESYEFVSDRLAIDLLLGAPRLRELIETQAPWPLIEAAVCERGDFDERRQRALLYP